MAHRSFSLVCLIALLCMAPVRRPHAEEINPPFGLRWGETAERMERLLQGRQGDDRRRAGTWRAAKPGTSRG